MTTTTTTQDPFTAALAGRIITRWAEMMTEDGLIGPSLAFDMAADSALRAGYECEEWAVCNEARSIARHAVGLPPEE